MTPEMAFECLLVSPDPVVFCTMHRVLKEFSIATNICLSASKASDLLDEGSTDLIVVDWDADSCADLVHEASTSCLHQKPTILALSADTHDILGVHAVVRKPVTRESAMESMRSVYSRMIQDFRRHVRYATMVSVQAVDHHSRTLSLTVTNIGDGGVGLFTKDSISMGDILSFYLPLPGTTNSISIQARVLWTRQYGAAGCEFVRIPRGDVHVLHDWLTGRCRIKKPMLDVMAVHL